MKSKNQKSLEVLKNMLGDDLFEQAMVTFAGKRLIFPKCPDFAEKAERNKQIISEYQSGDRVPVLMKRYDLSEAQIYRIIGKVC